MSAPSSFQCEPVSPMSRPPPLPPQYLKRQIYSDPSVFKPVDDHAINEARTNYRSFRDLMWNLIFKKNYNDLEKARVIFRWMTTKNMFTIMFDSELPGSPEQVLGGFKDGKTTYARIFECLACYAGLHCCTMSGWAKGVDYRPGAPITSGPINHSWNAVFIDGNWQLVDSHWATRYLQSERNTPENLVYEYDDFYFLPEPGQLVYSHCPEDPAWELVHPAKSRAEFEEYPLVKSYFFNIGMQFLQQNLGVLYTKRGLATITLAFTRPTAFTFKLAFGDNLGESVQGIQLKRYIIQETTQNRVTFYFRAPREGNYYLTVFGQQVGDRIRVENVFKAACEYKLVCDQAAGDIRPYPLCSDANWGPGAPVRQYGLTPQLATAILAAPNGKAEVAFTKSREVRLFARLVKDGMAEDVLERCVSVREQENQIHIAVTLPARGEYGLEIYANEPAKEGDTFTHMCQYLTSFTDRDFGAVYGQVYDRTDLAQTMQASPLTYLGPSQVQYAQQPTGGSMMRGPGGAPGGKEVYATQSRDWDGNTFTAKSYREEKQSGADNGHSYSQRTTQGDSLTRRTGSSSSEDPSQMTSRMESMTIGGKPVAPGTAPKPGQGRGYGGDDLPPPPPELMDQAYQQQRGAPESGEYRGYGVDSADAAAHGAQHQHPGAGANQPPVEIVYVHGQQHPRGGSTSSSSPSTLRRSQHAGGDEGGNKKPVEIVYVKGGTLRKSTDDKDTLGRSSPSGGSQGRGSPTSSARKPSVGSKGTSSQEDLSREHDADAPASSRGAHGVRSAVVAGSRAPSGGQLTQPDNEGAPPQESHVIPVQVGTNQSAPSDPYGRGAPAEQYGKGGPNDPYGKGGPNDLYGKGGPNDPYGKGGQGGPNDPYGKGGPNEPHGAAPYGRGQDSMNRRPGQDPRSQQANVAYPFGEQVPQAQVDYQQRLLEPEKEYTPHPQRVYTSSITVQAPTNFRPKRVDDAPAPKPAPPAVPPKPFKDTEIFKAVDLHAVEVSKEEHKNFKDLVWHLIYARDITNELEKARAIFLWLCSKDLTQLAFHDVKKGSPEEILMSLQQGKTTYAVVYETLCSYAGLHCKTLSGYAKGAEYRPGMKFTGEQGQHSWNAVLVNGAWRLVDCHWAARRLVGKKVTAENVRYELDEYYFMPDPHQLIFTHFPDSGSWQLLERSISLADFENLVPVKSAFFKYGLQILSHREAVMSTEREVTVRVGCPPLKSSSLAFTFTLAYSDGREEFQGIKLNRFGMQETLDHVSYFTIRPPEAANYRLIIYAKDLETASKEGVYGGVCEYELIMQGSPPSPQPFPPCVHTSWGAGDSASKYSLHPLQKGAIFSTVNGQAEVRFQLPKELRFTAKLKSNDRDEKALAGYIMHRVVADCAIFTINAPNRGEFGLEIYTNDPEKDGNSLFHAYQYLIICPEVKGTVEPLPTLPPGYLGPQPSFRQLGLSTASHSDPYIQTDNGELQVAFGMSQPLRMTSQLIYVSGDRSEDFTEYIMQQGRASNDLVTFLTKLPKAGLYKFQVYALPYSDSSESLPGVYNYLVNCTNTYATLIPFPKQYGQWKEGCMLHEPLEGQITPNRPSKGSASSFQYVYFKLDVPKANSVAVVIGEDWTQLEQKGGAGSSWEAEVFMEKHWGNESKAAVCANYGSVKASYSTLLEFSL